MYYIFRIFLYFGIFSFSYLGYDMTKEYINEKYKLKNK